MTDNNATPANDPGLKKYDLEHEACMLASMIEGLSVLHDQADGPEGCTIAKRARNSLAPTFDMVIQKAWALTTAIENAEDAARKKSVSQ
ncbi:MAG: hypothetical protein Q7J44_06220 [Pseudotabrizicola sp.]|uniref:hypothetical protein n=1 Tax=Pseudotabrizicola sp. TaxID=2939647 RepID=UPI002727F325|nr:hypothetical protein [Pseudotabrizicola sp.]MDO9638117.1 hypothetical protein [Pseudotabrizicola sp.]